jgi:hypothetical protein
MKENLPNLIIIGAHKAATTSLYTYLAAHEDIFGSGKKEVDYFTPLRYKEQPQSIEVYEKYFAGRKDEKYAIDASPAYMYGGKLLRDKMLEILPPHKIIIILREPVDRFLSNYNWLRAKLYIPPEEDLDVFIKKCIEEKEKPLIDNNFYGRSIEEGMYIDFVPGWVNAYNSDIKIIYFEKLINEPREIMVDIAKWLQIDETPFLEMEFSAENKTIFVKNKLVHSTALFLNNTFEIFLRKNHGLKVKLRKLYYKLNQEEKNKKATDEQSKQLLCSTYKKSNEELAKFFKSKNIKCSSWLK